MAAASPPAIANAPKRHQVGFIMNNGSMSYSVYLDADTYNLSFLAAQRAKYQTQSQQIEVLVDGAQVGLITPSSTTLYAFTRRRISRSRPECIPSSSSA